MGVFHVPFEGANLIPLSWMNDVGEFQFLPFHVLFQLDVVVRVARIRQHLVHVADGVESLLHTVDFGLLTDFAECLRNPTIAVRVGKTIDIHGYLETKPIGIGRLEDVVRKVVFLSGFLVGGNHFHFLEVQLILLDELINGTGGECEKENEE